MILTKKLDIFVILYLDDIFIYMEDPDYGHQKTVWSLFDIMRRHKLFINLKKY